MAFQDSILTVIQDVAGRVGINKPNTATGSSDPQIVQLVALANEETAALGARYAWTVLQNEATFTTVNAESQGTLIGTIIPAGQALKYVLNDTMWNRTQRISVPGPLTPQGWQGLKALTTAAGFWAKYRIRGNLLMMYPAPAAGQQVFFEYITAATVISGDGTAYNTRFTKDDDVPLLDPELIRLGVRWRWEKAKGLDYAEDFNSYEAQVLDAMTRDGTKTTARLDRDAQSSGLRPVVIVPAANWFH